MTNRLGFPILLILLSIAAQVEAMGADNAARSIDEDARFLVTQSRISNGICSIPFANDANLAIGLAQNSELMIHTAVGKNADLAAVQERLISLDMLGKRVYLNAGQDAPVSFADNYVDLMVVEDFALLANAGTSALELIRAIRPAGVLMVGFGTRDDTSVDGVRKWLSTVTDQVAIFEHAERNWALVRKPIPDGISEWRYWYGDAGNNPNSKDALIGKSHLVQWLGLPYYTTSEITSVIAGGRVFNILGGNVAFPFSKISPNEIVARSVYNGSVLWKAKLPDNFYAMRSAFIATDDTLYLLDANKCLLYDAANGQLRDTLTIGRSNEMLQWMALDGDRLIVLAGPPVQYSPRGKTYAAADEVDQSVSPWVFGHTFYCFDLNGRRVVWEHHEPVPVDALATGLTGGRIFCYAHGSHLGCLASDTGEPLWKNGNKQLFGEAYKANRLSFTEVRDGFINLLCNDQFVFLDPSTSRTLSAFNAKDGKLLWTKQKGNTRFDCRMLFADNKLLTNNLQGGAHVQALDPRTGEVVSKHVTARACTRITGCNGEIFTRDSFSTRATCVEGVIPASGMLYMSAYACSCNYQLLGSQTLGTGTPNLRMFAEKAGDRLSILQQFPVSDL